MYDKKVVEMTRKREVTFPKKLISIIVTNRIKYRKEGLALKTFVKIAKVLNRSLDDFIK